MNLSTVDAKAVLSNHPHVFDLFCIVGFSLCPTKESWLNINAINDSIKASFSITDKAVVSVMRGNAGAGGAMAAMASDFVWAHENVILNPHYKVQYRYARFDKKT